MEEVGYITETMARVHREEMPKEVEENALTQGRKKLQRGEGRRRGGDRWGITPTKRGKKKDRLLRQQCLDLQLLLPGTGDLSTA